MLQSDGQRPLSKPAVSVQQVNGYYCRTCADVELAKRGVDPAESRATERERGGTRGFALGEGALAAPGSELGSRLNVYA